MKKDFLILFLLLLIGGLSPLIFSFIGIGVTEGLGCNVDLHNPQACLILGIDVGPTLSEMGMMFWLGIVGVPIAAIGAVGLIIVGSIYLATPQANDPEKGADQG